MVAIKRKTEKEIKELVSQCTGSQVSSSKGNPLSWVLTPQHASLPRTLLSLAFLILVCLLIISLWSPTAALIMFQSPKLWWASWSKHALHKVFLGHKLLIPARHVSVGVTIQILGGFVLSLGAMIMYLLTHYLWKPKMLIMASGLIFSHFLFPIS